MHTQNRRVHLTIFFTVYLEAESINLLVGQC